MIRRRAIEEIISRREGGMLASVFDADRYLVIGRHSHFTLLSYFVLRAHTLISDYFVVAAVVSPAFGSFKYLSAERADGISGRLVSQVWHFIFADTHRQASGADMPELPHAHWPRHDIFVKALSFIRGEMASPIMGTYRPLTKFRISPITALTFSAFYSLILCRCYSRSPQLPRVTTSFITEPGRRMRMSMICRRGVLGSRYRDGNIVMPS